MNTLPINNFFSAQEPVLPKFLFSSFVLKNFSATTFLTTAWPTYLMHFMLKQWGLRIQVISLITNSYLVPRVHPGNQMLARTNLIKRFWRLCMGLAPTIWYNRHKRLNKQMEVFFNCAHMVWNPHCGSNSRQKLEFYWNSKLVTTECFTHLGELNMLMVIRF